MKKMGKKMLSVLLSALLLASFGALLQSAAAADYQITNPYAAVNWDTWKAYKGNLHMHTTFSDGNMSLADVVEEYYAQGYDAIAVTDHGVVGRPWDERPKLATPLDIQNWFKARPVLTSARAAAIAAGTDRDGQKMLNLPKGIEMNAAVLYKSHVNGFFVGAGQGYWGLENDYESVIRWTERAGGVSHINHPGDWLGSAGNPAAAKDPKNVNFFANILLKYPSCLGIEIYNRVDTVTRQDRILWDEILQRVIPRGRNCWGFSNDDSHVLSDIGATAEYFMMPANTVDNVRTAMETGAFFACSRYDRPLLGDESANREAPFPMVTRITADDANDVITLQTDSADTVRWIADGKVIAEGPSIDLRAHSDEITCYVRAQLIGEGGICTTQAFALDDGSGYRYQDPEVGLWESIQDRVVFCLKSNKIAFLIQLLIEALSK
ncbi:MAG: PHP domain-containing protein [Oscillospiraceae bacterium]|jgi:hypothetical protein|nr:PHP domain-containing protein [Oscillospiraceae bacterium]